MKHKSNVYREIIAILGMALLVGGITISSRAGGDFLYIGDDQDSTVKRFDANTGRYLGVFITSIANSNFFLNGPRGLIFNHRGQLLVANQNKDQSYAGEIFEYASTCTTGVFLKALVASTTLGAPNAPRGIILGDKYLFVASQANDFRNGNGSLRAFDPNTGAMVQELPIPSEFALSNFNPNGLVFYGGLLYVSNRHNTPKGAEGGEILRYNLDLTFRDVFIRSDLVSPNKNYLNAPEGLVFGPDGNLYVISYRIGGPPGRDTDKILIFAGPSKPNAKALLDKIDLDTPADPLRPRERAEGTALLFGPDGLLYVPITGPGSANMPPEDLGFSTGEVRRYNVHSKKYKVLVPPFFRGGPMQAPYYLTFGKTDPATLAYRGEEEEHEH